MAACTRNAGWRRPDSAWYWKFRLLQAEVLTTQSKDSDALKIVAQPLPARPELKELEARRSSIARAHELVSLYLALLR